MLRQAENAKAKMLQVAGKELIRDTMQQQRNISDSQDCDKKDLQENLLLHSVMVDEDFSVVGAYVDEITKRKIVVGEYVDFARLLPKDWVVIEEEKRLEFVTKNRQTYLMPCADHENSTINSFQKWEQAFRGFTAIFTEYFPNKAMELIQYNFVIHNALLAFQWDNVYGYDRDFCLHMVKHPGCSWGIILQQSWTMRMRDRITNNSRNWAGNSSSSNSNRKSCYRYN